MSETAMTQGAAPKHAQESQSEDGSNSAIAEPTAEPTPKIVLIDDEANVLNALKRALRGEPYELYVTTDGREGISLARQNKPAVVICDMKMPGLNGAEVLQAISEVSPDSARVLLTGYADMNSTIDAINLGKLHRYLSKPWDDVELKTVIADLVGLWNLKKERDRLSLQLSEKIIELETLNKELDRRVESRTQEIYQANLFLDQAHRELKTQFLSAVKVFSNLMEMRSPQMGGHSRRVAELARLLAKEMQCSDAEINDIYVASLLHDIGKISLSDHALFTPLVELNGEARAALMKHSVKGQAALMSLHDLHTAGLYIRHHHERFDGQGFPDGLIKSTIPLGSRILAVAEDYDELQLGWLANTKLTEKQAFDFIVNSAGKRYDPDVVEKLPFALEKIRSAPKEEEKIVTTEDIKPGMVITRDLNCREGFLLMAKDGVVTPSLIEHLKEVERHDGVALKVYVHRTRTGSYQRPKH